jgi:hypothetical protein
VNNVGARNSRSLHCATLRISCGGWWCWRPAPEALTCLGCFSSTLPQTRHPERSAAQIGRVSRTWCAESKDLGGTDSTHAARSFSTTKTRQQDLLQYALDGHGYIFSCTMRCGLGRKAPSSPGKITAPRSFDSAHQALSHAINLCGAPLRMTSLWEC